MTPQKVFTQIEEQRNVLISMLNMSKKNPIPPNRLSDVCMKLAILNELLGGFLPDLKMKQIEAEKAAFKKARDDGASATEAKEASRTKSAKARKDFEEVDIKHSDLWKLISMAQSHIRAEGQEQKV